MTQMSLDSTKSGRRSVRRGNTGSWGSLSRAKGILSGMILFVIGFTLVYSRKPTSVGSVLLKSLEDYTMSQQRLVTCDDFHLRGHNNGEEQQQAAKEEELMMTIRHWPRDQDFNTPSHCIYDVAEYSVDVTHCQCRNPTVPLPRTAQFWQFAFNRNQQIAKEAAETVSLLGTPLDVVLLGDSIIEHFIGTTGGKKNSAFFENAEAFEQVLTRKRGGAIDALALGIAADRIPNLLFRLQAARYGEYLRPRVWWILIGSNDMAMGWCNVDTVLAGHIAVVEEIQAMQPGAVVVINSILPRLPEPLLPHIDELNQRLRNYACQSKDVYFFDATSIFRDESTGQVRHLPDGVHPDGPASWIWAKDIARAVQELTGGV